MIDLAGSEKSSLESGKEMQNRTNKINKSLSTLSDVIMALSLNEDKKGEIIPFKNSVLTWLLTSSLSGNSKISLIGTIAPTDTSYDDSLNTLRFLERAKSPLLCHNDVSSNDGRCEDQSTLKELKKKNQKLDNDLIEANNKLAKREAEFIIQLGTATALSGAGGDDKSSQSADIDQLIKLLNVKQSIITNYESILSEQSNEGNTGSTSDQFKTLSQNYKKQKELSTSHYHDLKNKFR